MGAERSRPLYYGPGRRKPQLEGDHTLELDLADVNYLAVIAAIAVNMIVGAVWYSPLLFARPWMAANGFTEEQIKAQGSATRGYIVSVIASVVIAFAIALFAQAAGRWSPRSTGCCWGWRPASASWQRPPRPTTSSRTDP